MVDLTWHDFYSLGVESLDQEHKNLLLSMQKIKALINQSNMADAANEVEHLLQQANQHFKCEEAFLEKCAYPDLEEHKKYHSELICQAEQMKKICTGIVVNVDAEECFSNMSRFIIDDILKGDIKFKSFLEHQGLAER